MFRSFSFGVRSDGVARSYLMEARMGLSGIAGAMLGPMSGRRKRNTTICTIS
jgi:hypothetical protein